MTCTAATGRSAVSNARDQHPLALAFVEAAQQCGYPRNDDFNGATQEGAGLYQTTTRDGMRCSAATAYLKPARRPRQSARRHGCADHAHSVRGHAAPPASNISVGGETRTARAVARGRAVVRRVQFAATAATVGRRTRARCCNRFGIPDRRRHAGGRRRVSTITTPAASCCGVASRSRSTTPSAAGAEESRRLCVTRVSRRGYLTVSAISAGCFVRAHPLSETPDSQCSMALYSAELDRRQRCTPFPGVTGVLHAVAAGKPRLRAHQIRRSAPGPGDPSQLSRPPSATGKPPSPASR